MKFEEKLQKLRKASNITQEQLADKLNVSRQAVSKWESGASYPEMDKLIQMSKIFNCSLDDLVNDEETDKTIFKNQATKRNLYLDSFMEFINKSINMFSKMKFIHLVKCICELILIGFIIGICVAFCSEIIKMILNEILFFSVNDTVWYICSFISDLLSSIVFVALVIIGIIVFFQIYKIRYLDYYDKLMYEYEQRKELEEVVEVNKCKDNIDMKPKERIVIRDPEHRPFAFLSIFSGAIINLFKGCLALFSFGFVITLILGIISLVIAIYLLTVNKIFIGIIIGIIGLLTLNLIILEWNFKFVYNKEINITRLFVTSIISIVVSSIGAGIFIVCLKDFQFIEYSQDFKTTVDMIPYNKDINTISLGEYHYSVILKVDEEITNHIKVKYDYNEDIHDNKIVTVGNNIDIDFKPKIPNISGAFNLVLEDLKNDKLRLYDLYGYHQNIEISSNKENIEAIVKDLRDHEGINFVDENYNGIYIPY